MFSVSLRVRVKGEPGINGAVSLEADGNTGWHDHQGHIVRRQGTCQPIQYCTPYGDFEPLACRFEAPTNESDRCLVIQLRNSSDHVPIIFFLTILLADGELLCHENSTRLAKVSAPGNRLMMVTIGTIHRGAKLRITRENNFEWSENNGV